MGNAGWGLALGGAAAAAGILAWWFASRVFKQKLGVRERQVQEDARRESERLKQDAQAAIQQEQARARQKLDHDLEGARRELASEQDRLRKKEESLDRRLEMFTKKERFLEKTERSLTESKKKAEEREKQLDSQIHEEQQQLTAISGLSREQATEVLVKRLEKEMEEETAAVIHRATAKAEQEAKEKAREILALAIQRCVSAQTAATAVTTVDLPSDDLKGRIIGREGRNIRAFEKAAGVDVIVDDTPGVVVISSFDSLRREIGRRSILKLVADGRIHPGRIEEVVQESRKEMDKVILDAGKQAGLDAGVQGLHPKEVVLLGKLNFITSGGRSVLKHSLEVAQLCGAIAGELGLDAQLAKRMGLLHDIGRAVDQESEGSHSAVGAEQAKRCEESPEVVHAIAAHHGDEPAQSVYAVVLQAANQVSHERPGSAHEHVEKFMKRMAKLEDAVKTFPGIREAYALQAGREIRVIVDPEKVNDKTAARLCREVTQAIQKQFGHGELQVTVLREMRARAFARKMS